VAGKPLAMPAVPAFACHTDCGCRGGDTGRIWLAPALLLLLTCCGDGGATPLNAITASTQQAESWQQMVYDLRALQDGLETPDHLISSQTLDGTEFDPQAYFTILDRLEVEPEWVLDFVYCGSLYGGSPTLYSRVADQPRYTTCDGYRDAVGPGSIDQRDSGNLDHIRVIDGSFEGFFQLVVLRIMGEQFYLHWHAQADDALVVATPEAVTAAVAGVAGEMDEGEAARARAADPTPRISFGTPAGDDLLIEVMVFTRWGGLLRHTYTITREYPHRFLDVQIETVAECDCGITF
jgi:hypothetical protein